MGDQQEEEEVRDEVRKKQVDEPVVDIYASACSCWTELQGELEFFGK
jgi:hypothetical protein